MFTPEQIKHLKRASNDFVYFTNNIFAEGVRGFVGGEYIDNIARLLSHHRKTIRVSARDHCKSFLLYSHFMWRLMFEGADDTLEAHYFSFNEALASYHISKIKNCITSNPYFEDCKDQKPTAESVLKYTWDGQHSTTLTPHGLVQFKRGIHARLIYCDDPFQDPENDLNPTIIYKINEIFKSNIMDMPTEPDGELHVVGTAQTDEDFFFDKNIAKQFDVKIMPAISYTEEGEEQALWPEWMSLEELKQREELRGKRIFAREYLCLKPDTLIQTENSLKKIEDVKAGDMVVTHKGNIKPVLNTFRHKETELLDITTYGWLTPISITPNHPIYVFRNSKEQWIEAGNLTKQDYVLMPKIKGNGSKKISKNRAIIYGWYLAEGSIGAKDRAVTFHLGSKEVENIKILETALSEEGYSVKKYKHKQESVTPLTVNNVEFVNELIGMFGRGKGKKIPMEIFNTNDDTLRCLLDNYIRGDGSQDKNRPRIFSTSSVCLSLSESVSRIATRLNYSVSKEYNKIQKDSIIEGRTIKSCGYIHRIRIYTKPRQPIILDDYIGYQIKNISKSDYSGDVCNIEVANDNSYVTPMFAVHNCKPAYSARAYFDKDEINKKIVNGNIVNLKYTTQFVPRGQVVAGFDIGKKAHPAHLAVFEFYNNKLIMIHERWMDGWNYSNGKIYNPAQPTQLEYIKLVISNFKVSRLFYDNTRGEFESFDEQGLLPRQMEPIVFTVKTKNSVATEFDKVVEKRQIEIIDNQRTIDQMCSVTNMLQAPQSSSGHGESFWSIGLAVFSIKDSVSKDEYQGAVRNEIKAGQKSIFDDATPIPEGW